MAGREASDQFWNMTYNYCFFGGFMFPSSLAEMLGASEVVMRGPIVDIYVVWEEGASPSSEDIPRSHLAVKPIEILAGSPELDPDGNVRVTFGRTDDVDVLRSRLPGHDNLWFLKGTHVYYFAEYPQLSLLRDIGGKVRVIRPHAIARAFSERHYPVPLEGTPFEDLMERVRKLTSEGGRQLSLASSTDGGKPNVLFAC
ncbi:MAG: hypothetical protein ABI797_03190 [Chloroflexota bacterium]